MSELSLGESIPCHMGEVTTKVIKPFFPIKTLKLSPLHLSVGLELINLWFNCLYPCRCEFSVWNFCYFSFYLCCIYNKTTYTLTYYQVPLSFLKLPKALATLTCEWISPVKLAWIKTVYYLPDILNWYFLTIKHFIWQQHFLYQQTDVNKFFYALYNNWPF